MKIQEQAIHKLLDIEPYFLILTLIGAAWAFYKLLLKGATDERHVRIKEHFRYIFQMFYFFTGLFVTYLVLFYLGQNFAVLNRLSIYIGIATFTVGAVVTVRTSRLILLQYLFLGSMRAGVPLLIVNIFSLLLSFAILLWSLSYFFDIDLAPLLATSAALSIVLGLALQDTLGNLFAGISLQMDHSFEIGDWLEVVNGSEKLIGQVSEISWRSTTLLGWFNEAITLPNRFLASAQILNFKKGEVAIYRRQTFRVTHDVDPEVVRRILLDSLRGIIGVRQDMPAYCVIIENHESWLAFRLSFAIEDYSHQYLIAHDVVANGLLKLKEAKIKTAIAKQEIYFPESQKLDSITLK